MIITRYNKRRTAHCLSLSVCWPSDHQKLEREARICRLLKHPNIGEDTSFYFYSPRTNRTKYITSYFTVQTCWFIITSYCHEINHISAPFCQVKSVYFSMKRPNALHYSLLLIHSSCWWLGTVVMESSITQCNLTSICFWEIHPFVARTPHCTEHKYDVWFNYYDSLRFLPPTQILTCSSALVFILPLKTE